MGWLFGGKKKPKAPVPHLVKAAMTGNTKILEDALLADDITQADKDMALNKVMVYEEIYLAEMLLNAGADPNAKDDIGDTNLNICIYNGFTDTVKLLIKSGADLNSKDAQGKGVRYWAGQSTKSKQREALMALVSTNDNFEELLG